MGQSYIGEIRMFGGNFAPNGWLFCQGQLLSISEYEVLFQLIGTTYGGDGQSNFALPNLQSRLALHQGSDGQGNTYSQGMTGGVEQVTLTSNQMASHNHPMIANGNAGSGTTATGTNAIFGSPTSNETVYGPGSSTTPLSPKAIGISNGGSLPHSNIKPYLCVNFIISLYGVFPSRS